MRVLIVSNLYPPHYVGGYELRCSRVAEWLRRAGHEVRVLTSSYRLPGRPTDPLKNGVELVNEVPVERSLRYYSWAPPPRLLYTPRMARRQLADAARFLQLLREFRPDVVNWWNLEGLTKAILPIPRAQGIPDICWVEDVWLIRELGVSAANDGIGWFRFWEGAWGPAFLLPLLSPLVARWQEQVERKGIPTRLLAGVPRHACYVSEFMRLEHLRAGITFPSSQVIYGGVSPEQFCAPRERLLRDDGLRLLYAGYVEEKRGLHTILEALALLPPEVLKKVRLSIAASGPPRPTDYVERVHGLIRELGLSERVSFLGKRSHDQMPQVYQEHDLLIQASVRPEGMPLTMMEALCAGCAVITTGSGGAMELAEAAGLPIFPKKDPVALSRLLASLAANPDSVFEIASRGQQVVLGRFTFARMMQEFSEMLTSLCEQGANQPSSDEGSFANSATPCSVRKQGE
jgi:glycogen synthase